MLNRLLTILIVFSQVYPASLMALPSDRSQPIHIESNRAHRDERSGITIYEGAVVVIQGSIRIEADKVQITNRGNKANKIVCIGKPARYQQKPAEDDGLIIAKGRRIEYAIDQETVALIEDASLEQDGGIITGERIDYNLKNEIVNAKGSQSGKQRIQMVIPPQNLDKPDNRDPSEQP